MLGDYKRLDLFSVPPPDQAKSPGKQAEII